MTLRKIPFILLSSAVLVCRQNNEVAFLCPEEHQNEKSAIAMQAQLVSHGLGDKFGIRWRNGRIQVGRRREPKVFSWYALYEEKYFPLVARNGVK